MSKLFSELRDAMSEEAQARVKERADRLLAQIDAEAKQWDRQCISCAAVKDPYGNFPCACSGAHR